METPETKTNINDTFKSPSPNFPLSDDVRTLRLFVPGRVCLFGEHSDWAGSYRSMNADIAKGRCIVCGTNQGIYANVQAHPNKLICFSTDQHGQTLSGKYFECNMNLSELLNIAQSGSTYSYVAGVAYQIKLKHRIGGVIIHNYSTTLPLKKGLSSSAAITVLTARAFNKIYGLKLTIEGEMDYAYLGERTTPSQCGRMDQCCAYGSRPVVMEFDSDYVTSKELAISKSLFLVIVDLNKSKDTKTILADLNKCFAADKLVKNNQDIMAANCRKLFGEINLDITRRAMEAIKDGKIEIVGALMNEAQELFLKYAQPASPKQLASKWLYTLLKDNDLKKHIYGGKGVGSQGDGSAQFLCKSQFDQDKLCKLIETKYAKEGMSCIKLIIGGYQKIKKCVIPTANYNSSLFPASKTISTALFPIIDSDGLLKPAILILIEEVIQCGIEEIILIVSQHDLESFKSLFFKKIPLEQIEKLSPELQTYSEKILSYGSKIKFIVQTDQLGLGHAVYQAKNEINSEKFLLLLGDHLYSAKNEKHGCIQQLISYYNKNGCNCYGIQRNHVSEIKNFGTVSGKWLDMDEKICIFVEQIVEKPKVEYAQKHLKVDGLSEYDEFLTIFGLYILDGARLIELLGNNINNKPPIRHNGSFQLTPCLQLLRNEQETHGLIINGRRFDIGASPTSYADTVGNFHKIKETKMNYSKSMSEMICYDEVNVNGNEQDSESTTLQKMNVLIDLLQ